MIRGVFHLYFDLICGVFALQEAKLLFRFCLHEYCLHIQRLRPILPTAAEPVPREAAHRDLKHSSFTGCAYLRSGVSYIILALAIIWSEGCERIIGIVRPTCQPAHLWLVISQTPLSLNLTTLHSLLVGYTTPEPPRPTHDISRLINR